MYPTVRATVSDGQVRLIENVKLPENATLLVTVLDNKAIETLSLGEHLILSLEDILAGRVVEIDTQAALQNHLDLVFQESD